MEARTDEPATLTERICRSVGELGELAEPDQVQALIDIEQMSRWLESQRHLVSVAIAGASPVDFVSHSTGSRIKDMHLDEIAVAMEWTPEWTRRQVTVSRLLVTKLPRLLGLLELGRISTYQAWAAVDGLRELFSAAGLDVDEPQTGNQLADAYSSRMESRVDDSPGGMFRRAARQALAELVPIGAEDRHQQAALNRFVKLSQARDGMAFINAYLTAIEAQRVLGSVTAAAETCPALNGSQSQNQADAFVGLLTGSLKADGEWTPPSTEIQIIVPLDVLTGESPGSGQVVDSEAVVLRSELLELLEDARLRRVVTDPLSNQVLEFGRTTYRPPAVLRDHVVTRDRYCRFPGCKKPANRIDLDHVQPWDSGGETREQNLVALCRRHHNLKTHLGWICELLPDGTVRWLSPSGYQWTDPAKRLTG